jgi:hypothetical protein
MDLQNRGDVRVTLMKPSLVKSKVLGSVPTFIGGLSTVRSTIEELNVPKSIVSKVLYPMSGFDLTTPLRLFPEADTYILVDNHTLMRAEDVSGFARRQLETEYRDRNGAFVRYDATGSNVFSKLMTSLFATLPEAKIQSIEFITDSYGFVSTRVVVTEPSTGQTKTIFYLTGEIGNVNHQAAGSAQRDETYSVSGPVSRTHNWWDEMVAAMAPQTILLKGSMSALRQTAYEELLEGRERILGPILSNGGLIVEGASVMPPWRDAEWARRLEPERDPWELTDGDPRLQKPVRDRVLRNVLFSYSNSVHIALYGPQKPLRARR